uniref:Uncharacterized protein n=1 Tax=Oryza nivara TaxID=4536 RepID=A0A0E0IJU7_ORYNI
MAARPTGGTAANRRRSLAVIVQGGGRSPTKPRMVRVLRELRALLSSVERGSKVRAQEIGRSFDWYTVPLFEFFHQNLFDQVRLLLPLEDEKATSSDDDCLPAGSGDRVDWAQRRATVDAAGGGQIWAAPSLPAEPPRRLRRPVCARALAPPDPSPRRRAFAGSTLSVSPLLLVKSSLLLLSGRCRRSLPPQASVAAPSLREPAPRGSPPSAPRGRRHGRSLSPLAAAAASTRREKDGIRYG